MRMMKKKIIIVSVSIILAIVVTSIAIVVSYIKNGGDGYDMAAEGLDVEFDADIIVYGEEPGFRDILKYRTIDEISEETLDSSSEHGYRAIVLYDRKGTMSVTDEELLIIKKYVEEYGYDMIYIGKNYLDDFERLGFTVGCAEDAYSFEYIGSIHVNEDVQQNEIGNLYAEHGLWRDGDELSFDEKSEELQSRIVGIMYDYAREATGIAY